MTDIGALLQQGAGNAWLFIPTAILLGALHGLEPGHSKTMMAAFIVAIRGTVKQAMLLGIMATLSHTAVVWAVAMTGLYFGGQFDAETTEPYFQLGSAVIIIMLAVWMIARTRREQLAAGHHHHHDHDHHHHHEHDQADCCNHQHTELNGLTLDSTEYQDAHARAHARDIQRRFSDRQVTNWQITLFGLTGGLIPCPAAITVLLLCLQLKQFSLGAALVVCFSIGLALTLVCSGTLAAIGVRHAGRRWPGFSRFAQRAPYASGGVIILLGLYISYQALLHLHLL